MAPANEIINRLIDPVSRAITGESARRIIELPTDPELDVWMADMAARANEGRLTAEERSTYEYVLMAGTVISLLQIKARAALAASAPTAA